VSGRTGAARYVVDFDSGVNMVRAGPVPARQGSPRPIDRTRFTRLGAPGVVALGAGSSRDLLQDGRAHDSGARVADYLARQGSPRRRWQAPRSDGRRPEAEWGFDPAIRPDLERVAARFGYRLRRLVMHEPQDLSPFVADLYRWWYRRRWLSAQRLLVESYVQWEPLWTLRLRSAVLDAVQHGTRP
jgi:hypothetical protein